MTVSPDPTVVRQFKHASIIGSVAVTAAGALVLLGWLFDVTLLKSMHPSLATMKPNTALGFVLIGAALYLRHGAQDVRREHWARALAMAVAALGGLTLLEYLLDLNLGLDELLFRDIHAGPDVPPGRMSPATALGMTLVGGALVLENGGRGVARHRVTECLVLVAAISALLSLLGYIYGARSLYKIGPYVSVALHTTLAFLVSCASILLARPEEGLTKLVASDSPAGVMSRRLLPAALLVPAVLGWLRLRGQQAGYYDTEFGLALFAAANVVCFTALIWWSAGILFAADSARRNAEAALSESEEDLRITLQSIGDAVIATDAKGHVTKMNPAAEQLTGWTLEEARGMELSKVFHILNEESRDEVESPVDRVIRAGVAVGLANHTVLLSKDGTERAIADSGAPIRDGEGSLRGVVLVFHDQTEQRSAARTLERSEGRFRRLAEAGIIGVIAADLEGNILRANDAFLKMVGYTSAEVGSGKMRWREMTPAEWRQLDDRSIEQLKATGVAAPCEKEYLRKDGSRVPVLVGAAMVDHGAGECIAFVLDLTEQRRAEEALRLSERRFRGFKEAGIIGIVLADASGNIREVNDAFLSIVGYTRDDFLAGMLSGKILNTPERECAEATVRVELQTTGVAHTWEKELVRKDGTRVPVLMGVVVLEEPTQESVTFVLDLTERKRAEALAHENEARKAAVMEAALDAIILMDRDGRIIDFNPAAERVFGYTRDEILGEVLADVLIPPYLRDKHRAGLQHYLETGEGNILGKRVDLRALRKDGTEFPAEIAVLRIRSEGEAVFTGYVRDITERQQAAEAELLRRENEAAQAANRELEAFSYSVAHDLRAPLRSISGFVGAFLEDHGSLLDEGAKAPLLRVAAGAERMGHMIDALLSLARLSRAELRREIVDLTSIAREIIAQLRAAEPERSVELVATGNITARGDPQLLRAVLDNLLRNAWKFTKNQPHAQIEIGCAVLAHGLCYYVRDNGAGFDMTFAHRLFTPFQRLHSTEEFEGTGIGLATVQRIILRHGGRVWAEAEEGKGAAFLFTLHAEDSSAMGASWKPAS